MSTEPYPQAPHGEKWEVEAIYAGGDEDDEHLAFHQEERVFTTLADTSHPTVRRFEAHSLAHVAATPDGITTLARKHDFAEHLIHSLEDCRINKAARAKTSTLSADIDGGAMLGENLISWAVSNRMLNPYQMSLLLVAAHGTADEAVIRKYAGRAKDYRDPIAVADEVIAEITPDSTVDDVVRIATRLKREGFTERELPQAGAGSDLLDAELGTHVEKSQFPISVPAESPSKGGVYINDLHSQWGTMYVETASLDGELPDHGNKLRKKRAGHSGSFRAVHRIRLDHKVFRERRGERIEKRTGTVLVDASGSMSLTARDILEVLKRAPDARVAIYWGNGDSGVLQIVAEHGRYCTNPVTRGYMNVIDGPALSWLGQQPAPRSWISDGYITGKGDSSSSRLEFEKNKLVRDHEITQFERVREFLDHLDAVATAGKLDGRR
jgi:hypothetical protein